MSNPVSIINEKGKSMKVRPASYKVTQATAANDPIPLANSETLFREATIYGQNNFGAGNANTGNVNIRALAAAGNITKTILPDEGITIAAPLGCVFDLQDFYLDAVTNADGVVIEYDLDPGETVHADIAGS